MISKIRKAVLVILFGKSSLNGYYKPTDKAKTEKKYVFSSVFPSRAVMESVLNTTIVE